MTKSNMYIIIALLIIIIAVLAIYFLMPKDPKITTIKTYTFPDGSFSFKYPEFEKWTSNPITELREPNVVSPSGQILVLRISVTSHLKLVS